MVSWDYYVGFERQPLGLDAFLQSKGYEPVITNKSVRVYESTGNELIDVFHHLKTKKVKRGEVPDWSKSRYKIVSDLEITSNDSRAINEAEKLAEAIVREFDAILCEDIDGELRFLRKREL